MEKGIDEIVRRLMYVDDNGTVMVGGVVELENGRRVRVQFEVDLNDKERKAIAQWLKGE